MRFLVPLIAAGLLLTAGCGGGGDDSAGGSTTTAPAGTGTDSTAETEGDGTEQGDPSNGEILFVTNSCSFCHTLQDVAASGNVGPNLDETKPSYDLVVERVTNGKAPMPSFKDDMTPQDIQDLAAYVSSVAGKKPTP